MVGEKRASAGRNWGFGQKNGDSFDDLLTLPGAEQVEETDEVDAAL